MTLTGLLLRWLALLLAVLAACYVVNLFVESEAARVLVGMPLGAAASLVGLAAYDDYTRGW